MARKASNTKLICINEFGPGLSENAITLKFAMCLRVEFSLESGARQDLCLMKACVWLYLIFFSK